jgi:hypothetical protein
MKRSAIEIVDEMFELGVSMRRERFRRERPELTDAEIERLVLDWVRDRPDAPFGDADGRPGVWPRR